MIDDPDLVGRAESLIGIYARNGKRIATAESCTGGLVSALLTSIAGSSAVLDRGFVTYSNEAKSAMLGVSEALIGSEGAVSEAVARAMAEGALARSRADVAVAITGIAGPGGGSERKPIGLVHLALATKVNAHHLEKRYGNRGRAGIRRAALEDALSLLEAALAPS